MSVLGSRGGHFPREASLSFHSAATGGVISFDTSGGSTSSFTVLIDGDSTKNVSGILWDKPICPVYRGLNNPEGRPTIFIAQIGWRHATSTSQHEFYLDDTDAGTGNLLYRGSPYMWASWPWNAQLDEVNGTILHLPRGWYQGEIRLYRSDDSLDGVATLPELQGGADMDRPGFSCMAISPIDKQISVSYPSIPASPAQIEYAVRNKQYAGDGDISYTVLESPDVPWLSLDKTSGGPIAVGTPDLVTASIDASSMSPGTYTTDLVYTDTTCNPAHPHTRTVELQVLECQWEVNGLTDDTPFTFYGGCNNDNGNKVDYPSLTISNLIGLDLTYTIEEVTSMDPGTAVPTDYPWLAIDKTSGGPVSAGSSDTAAITITSDNTDKTGYIRITPSCGTSSSGVSVEYRQIDVVYNIYDDGVEHSIGYKGLYLGDVDPMSAGSCGTECTFDPELVPVTISTVVTDKDAQNRKAFYIQDTVEAETIQLCSKHEVGGAWDDVFHGFLGTTMVARLKVTSNTNMVGHMWNRMNNWPRTNVMLTWGGAEGGALAGKIREDMQALPVGSRTTGELASTPQDQGAYHIIRLVNGFGPYGDRTVKIYYDENPTPVLSLESVPYPPAFATPYHRFCIGIFGDDTSLGEVYYDWVSWTNWGMYAPGEEDACIGSLIPDLPACNTLLFFDADIDGDVDQDDFAKFQACYSGSGNSVTGDCICSDDDGDTDVDDDDFTAFQACASGPNVPANPACDD